MEKGKKIITIHISRKDYNEIMSIINDPGITEITDEMLESLSEAQKDILYSDIDEEFDGVKREVIIYDNF